MEQDEQKENKRKFLQIRRRRRIHRSETAVDSTFNDNSDFQPGSGRGFRRSRISDGKGGGAMRRRGQHRN